MLPPRRRWYASPKLYGAMGMTAIAVASVAMEAARHRARRRTAPLPSPDGSAAHPHPTGPADQPETKPQDDSGGDVSGPSAPLLGFLGFYLGFGVLLLAIVFGGLWAYGYRQHPAETTHLVPGGDRLRGRAAIVIHGCGTCHVIPGINSATGRVGPQLHDFGEQMYVAGVLPNTTDNLIKWIRDPKEVDPLTAMPDLNIGDREARDIAAYIYDPP